MFWYPKESDLDVKDEQGVTLRDFLKAYDPGRYDRPAVTVDVLAFRRRADGLQILLIRRARHPALGMLALPGGFMEMDESLEEAAARELYEETGLSGVSLTQLGAYGDVHRDPRMRIVTVAFTATVGEDARCRAGDDAAEAGFFDLQEQTEADGRQTFRRITVRNGNVSAGATVRECGGSREIMDSTIASDHCLMILDALDRMNREGAGGV